MKCTEVEHCSFTYWYPLFEDITYKSIIIPLPKSVLSYFEDGGTVVLPVDCQSDDGDDSYDEPGLPFPDLGDFSEKLKNAIKTLGGAVLPKLNWSSPKDCVWMSYSNSLKCLTPTDIYVLMKSSQFVSHDLVSPFKDCDDVSTFNSITEYCLILREWKQINPSNEFRCYVKDSRLIAISQREASQYYSNIGEQEEDIISDINSFYENYIKNKFSQSSYTFDVHRLGKENVYLIDFGPFGVTTDSILFSWEELLNDKNEELMLDAKPKFRYVDVNIGIQPSPYVQYNYPLDMYLLSDQKPSNANHEELLLQMI